MTRPLPLLDLAFLLLDRPETPSNVGVIMLLDPPPGRSAAAAAAQLVRAYRSARPGPPFDCVPDLSARTLPRWQPAERIDLRRHVLRETLETPGRLEDLCRRVARLHEPLLDRSRPLFELHVIDGLATGQLAVYLKSHHACWDGRYALERVFGAMAREPGPVGAPFFAAAPERGRPVPANAPVDGVAAGLKSLFVQAAAAGELLSKLSARARALAGARQPGGNRPFAGPHTRFNDPVRTERSVAFFRLPLEQMQRVARACGGTLNDVALAVIDAGVERLLTSLGERPREPLVSMCPVSVRAPGDYEPTTKAITLFVPLARPGSGALARLRQIASNTRAAKDEFGGFSHDAALDYAALAFGLWFASSKLGFGAITRPVINLVVSNVGAVEAQRYVGECRLAAAFPVSMIADPTGLNVTLLSVDGHMDFGIVANAAVLADAFELASACQSAFAQLSRAAKRATVAAKRTPPRRARRAAPSGPSR